MAACHDLLKPPGIRLLREAEEAACVAVVSTLTERAAGLASDPGSAIDGLDRLGDDLAQPPQVMFSI